MAGCRFFHAADTRQDEVWAYTCDQWGEAQAKKYIQGLHRHIQKLANRKIPRRPIPAGLTVPPDLDVQIYFSRYEKHDVFFRELSRDLIGVMSILHASMQIPIRLGEDLKKIESQEK